MKYIFFVSREIWPAFNSIYAYVTLKREFPDRFVALYTKKENMYTLESMLMSLTAELGKNIPIDKIKLSTNSIEDVRKILEDVVESGDIVDITGARKMMILSLMSLSEIKVVYLLLRDMRYSGVPFMMRPLTVQEHMEVKI
ncbi:MAG: hypothetical protein GXO25_04325 [Euryarchaeota archaeon]|nr:hypothetical protein [Euryarchaeota archaeon]